MAWFDDLNLPGSTVTGHFAFVREDGPDVDDAPDLQLAGGTVRFEPTAKAVRAGGAWVGIAPVTAVVFDGELVVSEEDPRPLRLLSTDADTGVEGWGWEATFNIDGASIKPIRFHAPAGGVHLTGDDLIPITGLPVEVIHGGAVTASSITDATEVGRAVLTAPLTADGRRALNIWDGTRAHLDAGTDTAERTWEAKDLAEFVTDTVAAAGGAASWDDLTGKPETFPPSAHTHDDRYYTEAEVDQKVAGLAYSTGWRRIAPATTTGYAFDGTGSIYLRRRSGGSPDGKGDFVDVRFENVGVVAGTATNAYLTPTHWLPAGFLAWFYERAWYLVGNVNANIEYKIGIVQSHRLRLSPDSPVPGTGRDALQGTITFPTDDPRPTNLPGAAHTF